MDKENLLRGILLSIKPNEKEEKEIMGEIFKILASLNNALKKSKIKASAVVGGSFAKGTTIKKDRYDVDIFIVFDKEYESEKISDITEKILKKLKMKAERLPGSRDYFNVNCGKFMAEIVPVIKIKKAEEAENITDLSLLHVKYIANEIKKNKRLGDEIRLSKAFCYANDCYGAESHIRGFSGYCLELLTSYYGSFFNLVKAASKWKAKTIIDINRYYKKRNVLAELNEAKLISPLILIDPVQRDRNAAAALSDEKFNVFVSLCRLFLKKPSKRFFEKKDVDEEEIIKNAKKEKAELYKVIAKSEKKKEDISGSKLLKLFELLRSRIEKEGYKVKARWNFKDKKADMWFSIKKIKRIIKPGPFIDMKKHVLEFKKKYKRWFVKNKRIYAFTKPKPLKKIFSVDKKQLSEMGIDSYVIRRLL